MAIQEQDLCPRWFAFRMNDLRMATLLKIAKSANQSEIYLLKSEIVR